MTSEGGITKNHFYKVLLGKLLKIRFLEKLKKNAYFSLVHFFLHRVLIQVVPKVELTKKFRVHRKRLI